jgi:hypothetical protein
MIEITKVGLINIDTDSLAGVTKFKWVVVSAEGPHVRFHFVENGGHGAVRIRYYKEGAQVQIEGLKPGLYKTITRPYTISFNLDRDISNDY